MALVVSQIIGITAVTLFLLSFQLNNRKQIVLTTGLSSALYVLQYLLLGAFSGAVLDVLSTASSFFAYQKNSSPFQRYARHIAAFSVILITITGLFLSYIQRDVMELLPIVGATLQTGGLWCHNEQNIRKFGLAGAPFWLIYNYCSQAYGAAIGSALTIISTITAIIRYKKSSGVKFK